MATLNDINLDNKYAVDIMLEPAPNIDITIHLNKAYFNFKYPSSMSTDGAPTKVMFTIAEYGRNSDGSMNTGELLSNITDEFSPNSGANSPLVKEIPQHQAYFNLNNSYYIMSFSYIYILSASDAIDYSYSKKRIIIVNNTIPTIYSGMISPYLSGKLAADVINTKQITLWFDTNNIMAENGDIIAYEDGYNFQQINEVNEDGTPRNISLLDKSYMDFILKLIRTPEFTDTINTYYENLPPEEGSIQFMFQHNQRDYNFYLNGNIKTFLQKYN